MEGINLKGDFEQRRSVWGKSENKAACFECGNTHRFKDQFPIWIQKKKSGPAETQQPTPKGKDQKTKREEGKGGAGAVKFAWLEMDECDPSIGEIPEMR